MDKRLFFLINKARHSLYKHMEEVMSESIGVPVAQITALLALGVRDGCQPKELGYFLNLNKSGITGLTDRMERNDLLRKVPDENDGRASRLFITEKGKYILQKAKPIIKDQNLKLQQGFSDDEIETVIRFLSHVSETKNLI